MRHHLNIAQYSILGAFALFLMFTILFSIEGDFAGRATTGTTVNISPSAPQVCYFTIGEGYNIISMPCLSSAELVSNVTNGTPIAAMYQYTPGSDVWKVYNPNLPSYVVSDLQFMTRRAGYIVLANGSANRSFDGRRVEFTDIPIVPGWSLVGYPTNLTQNITTATASVSASFNVIVTYNKSGESFVSYTNPGGALQYMTPGEGYWINGTAPASWTVTW
jgi:hypothetical protein